MSSEPLCIFRRLTDLRWARVPPAKTSQSHILPGVPPLLKRSSPGPEASRPASLPQAAIRLPPTLLGQTPSPPPLTLFTTSTVSGAIACLPERTTPTNNTTTTACPPPPAMLNITPLPNLRPHPVRIFIPSRRTHIKQPLLMATFSKTNGAIRYIPLYTTTRIHNCTITPPLRP